MTLTLPPPSLPLIFGPISHELWRYQGHDYCGPYPFVEIELQWRDCLLVIGGKFMARRYRVEFVRS